MCLKFHVNVDFLTNDHFNDQSLQNVEYTSVIVYNLKVQYCSSRAVIEVNSTLNVNVVVKIWIGFLLQSRYFSFFYFSL